MKQLRETAVAMAASKLPRDTIDRSCKESCLLLGRPRGYITNSNRASHSFYIGAVVGELQSPFGRKTRRKSSQMPTPGVGVEDEAPMLALHSSAELAVG
jgi:hypothetical protein